MERAGEDFLPLAEESRLKLRVVPSSAIIHSDRKLLTRMIGNLLSNAIKYTDQGNILLGVRRRGKSIRIEVHDTGIGIKNENIEEIFEEFHRIGGDEGGRLGLGLGLYIVRRFALLLHHSVEVSSRPGKGTKFAIVVPEARFPSDLYPESNDEKLVASPTVLLVEDDSEQLDTLRQLLELENYGVAAARTGTEALALLDGQLPVQPHLIIADYSLPGEINGIALTRMVRERMNSDVPALIVSGERPVTDAASSGGTPPVFIAKPVRTADLLTTAEMMARSVIPSWQRQTQRRTGAKSATGSAETGPADIAVVDDDPTVRNALVEVLTAEGYKIRSYASAEGFLADPDRSGFRCLIADLVLPGMDGLALQEKMASEQRDLPIVFLSGANELPIAVKAMRAGAADFLQKPVGREDLRDSVERALKERDRSGQGQEEREAVARRLAALTERERQVMELMVAGELNKNIAANLGISLRTVEHHRHSVLRKMAVRSLARLVQMVGMNSGSK